MAFKTDRAMIKQCVSKRVKEVRRETEEALADIFICFCSSE